MDDYRMIYQASSTRIHDLLTARGYKRLISNPVIETALVFQSNKVPEETLGVVKAFFSQRAVIIPEGLEFIPRIWLEKLPEILWGSRKPHWERLPYMIKRIFFEDGVLRLILAQEQPHQTDVTTACDRLRITINLQLQPNIWTLLPPRLERSLWMSFPHLRKDLFTLP
jgi:hypothetical protein